MRPLRTGLSVLVAVALCAGCNPFGASEYDVQGRVVGFGDDGRTVIVEHGDIPGLMPAMTMPFQALDTAAVAALEYGDAVSFTLAVSRDSSWIYDVAELPPGTLPAGLTQSSTIPTRSAGTEPILQPGDAVPSFELVNQAGGPVGSEDYAGTALLVNFIYTRCPLPEYCPLLSGRFAEIQPVLAEQYGGRARLLTITIDPEHDTPEVLRAYAARYTDDLSNWTFATGSPADVARVAHWFGMYYEGTGADLNHSLATALVGPDGRLLEVWRGAQWTTDDVLDALAEAVPES